MYRGTTPTITLQFNSDLDLSTMEQIWVTFEGKNAEVTHDITTLDLDVENSRISVTLSQEDTLKFQNLKGKVEVQARFLDNEGVAMASDIAEIDLNRILKEGVISTNG